MNAVPEPAKDAALRLLRKYSPQPQAASVPANVDAEKAILGAILLDNAAHSEAMELGLATADFYLDSDRLLWKCMTAMLKAERAVDIVTLSESLERSKEIEGLGGRAYLFELTEGLPLNFAIVEYVLIVRQKAL